MMASTVGQVVLDTQYHLYRGLLPPLSREARKISQDPPLTPTSSWTWTANDGLLSVFGSGDGEDEEQDVASNAAQEVRGTRRPRSATTLCNATVVEYAWYSYIHQSCPF
jgi:hypothetical protein